MTAPKSLPARPSLESLRKQAKKLARDVAAGDEAALARARAHFPQAEPPVTQRDAQLVIAREYGFAGWRELTAEVGRRLGRGLEWAITEARRVVHDNDVDRLKQLLAEYPALLSWQEDDEHGGLLGMATGAYADAGDEQREQWFTRGACAEALIDMGAVVASSVCEDILRSRARGLLDLFQRKGLLPGTLKFLAALGRTDDVRRVLADQSPDLETVNEAFRRACDFEQEAVASLLLERCVALDPDLRRHLDGTVDRQAFVASFIEKYGRAHTAASGLWIAFVMDQVSRAAHHDDVAALVGWLKREPQLLGDEAVDFQNGLIGAAVLNDRGSIIAALLELDPAIVRRPPPSQAIELAFTYGTAHLLPLLTQIWPIADDLPHAAGTGDLARVRRWFDVDGKPALGELGKHQPATSVHPREPQWGDVGVQEVLDTAFAWAVINRHFDVADFLLAHGADVSTRWSSHEPASILHHLVFLPDPYERMQYLIDRGIDLTIKDYRWNATAQGWAYHALKDEKMAQWLADAELRRSRGG